MNMFNGFKVIKPDEKIVGKVVESSGKDFVLVDHYVNGYDEHKKRNLETFSVEPQEDSKEYWKAFEKELNMYARKGTVSLSEEVFKILQKSS